MDELARGLALYRAARFFEAHEAWEDGWRTARGDERRLLHGLIQLAAVQVHLERGNLAGAERLLAKASRKLAPLGAFCGGVELAALCGEVERRLATSRRR